MPVQKQIHELSERGTTPSGTNILHTQDPGNIDVTMTIQDILDLVPDADTAPGDLSGSIDTSNDQVVITDDSSSDALKKVPWATFVSALGVASVTGDASAATDSFQIGPLQIRWGYETSSSDSSEGFTFDSAFSNSCHGMLITRVASQKKLDLNYSAVTTTGFTVIRDPGINGDEDFFYVAIGY